MQITTTTTPIDRGTAARALAAAVADAALAPSIHNTQPWRWRIRGAVADLYADLSRHLRVADPDRRLLTLSCGATLYQADLALAAAGFTTTVTRLANTDDDDHIAAALARAGDPSHLASITVTGHGTPSEATVRLHRIAEIRHTDRRPLLDEPISAAATAALVATARPFGIGLHLLHRDQIIELASAMSRAQDGEVDDVAARAELDAWTAHRPAAAGVPDAEIPNRPPPTTVPMRDFGHVGTLPVPAGHDNAATYAILYGVADQPRNWLRAGEALSAIWLAATQHQIALLPMSVAIESPAGRRELQRILSGIGYPYLVLRLGIADPNLPAAPRTPRLPARSTTEILP
jgi:nitroreductase